MMKRLTPQLLNQIQASGVPIKEITLKDLAKAKPIYIQKDGNQVQNIQTADPGSCK